MSYCKTLVIVESPAKSKKIQSFLGPGYIVKASFGHIRNLDTKRGVGAIDIDAGFKPHFVLSPEKIKQVQELQKWTRQCSDVIIASDLDREGEAIGYHLTQVLKLNPKTTKRIVFNEITKSAILNAVKQPRLLDTRLIDAQLARQIIDYLIGFKLSPVLWKYVKNNLSAGRCQSVALRLIYERGEKLSSFAAKKFVQLKGDFYVPLNVQRGGSNSSKKSSGSKDFTFEATCTTKQGSIEKISTLFQQWTHPNCRFTVHTLKRTQSTTQPPPPYITSSIQQDCSAKLGYSPKMTMSILQKLYEAGKITYMRTDSVSLSKTCAEATRQEVSRLFGTSALYSSTRRYSGKKTQHTQEAHECIRPVYVSNATLGSGFPNSHQAVYSLIWKRTMATQMCPIIQDHLNCTIKNSHNSLLFSTTFTKTVDLGFSILYNSKMVDTLSTAMKLLRSNTVVHFKTIQGEERYSTPPARYSEATLIKELETRGIGRPSTFSSIVGKLLDKKYVEKKTSPGTDADVQVWTLCKKQNNNHKIVKTTRTIKIDKYAGKLVITHIGKLVNEFLVSHFDKIMNYEYTNALEKSLDDIANGARQKLSVIKHAFNDFDPIVAQLQSVRKVKKSGTPKRDVFMNDPQTGAPIFVYEARYGPVVQVGKKGRSTVGKSTKKTGTQKPVFFPLPKMIDLTTLTPQLVEYFMSFPKVVGKNSSGQSITLKMTNNGFTGICGKSSFAVPNPLNPRDGTAWKTPSLKVLKSLCETHQQKHKSAQQSIIHTFEDGRITVRKGPYGYYILEKTPGRAPNKIRPVPSNLKVQTLSREQIENILATPQQIRKRSPAKFKRTPKNIKKKNTR